jgi:hypothetical protein
MYSCCACSVEAMFSTACTPRSECATGMIKFWLLFVVFVFVDAFVQLAFVSDMLPGGKQAVISTAQGVGSWLYRLAKASWRAIASCIACVCRCGSSTPDDPEAELGAIRRLIVWICALFVRASRACRRKQLQLPTPVPVDTSPDIRIKCLVYFFQVHHCMYCVRSRIHRLVSLRARF